MHPRDKVSVGAIAKLAPVAYAVAPALGRWVMARVMEYGLERAPAQAPTSGALFSPASDTGGAGHRSESDSDGGARAPTVAKLAGLGAVLVLGVVWLGAVSRR